MAKQCSVCGKKLTFMEPGNMIDGRYSEIELCMSCFEKFRNLESTTDREKYEQDYAFFTRFLAAPSTPQPIKDKMAKKREEMEKRVEKVRREEEKKRDYDDRIKNMLISTSDVLMGYDIKRYYGMVSMDVLFQNGVKEMIGSVANNFGNNAPDGVFAGREIKVVTDLVENAKKNVLEQMQIKAADMGANCILGVKVDVTFFMPSGNQNVVWAPALAEFVKVSMSGTAALIEKK